MSNAEPINSNDQFPSEERNLLSLFSRKKDLILTLVNKRLSEGDAVRKSISKGDLRNHIEELLAKGILYPSDIAALIDQLQGWGRQQIYLFTAAIDEIEKRNWLNSVWVKTRFEEADLVDIFNDARPATYSEDPTLFEAEHSENEGHIRFKWAEVVGTLDRRPEKDIVKPFERSADGTRYQRMVYHAYLEAFATDISSFEWDIQSGNAMFMIRKHSNRSYKDVRDNMISDVARIVPIEKKFLPIELRKLLRNLDEIEEVNKRRLRFRSTHNRGGITLSAGNDNDIFDDEILRQAYESFERDADRLGGSVSWPVDGRKPIGVYLYARDKHDQRIGIGAQALEEEIRSVLQDIRRYST